MILKAIEAGVGAVVQAVAIVARAGVCHLLDPFPRVHGPLVVLARYTALSQGMSVRFVSLLYM
jgi:hypothetical protein